MAPGMSPTMTTSWSPDDFTMVTLLGVITARCVPSVEMSITGHPCMSRAPAPDSIDMEEPFQCTRGCAEVAMCTPQSSAATARTSLLGIMSML